MNNASLRLGTSGSFAPFGGLLDEVLIYNRALSGPEIEDIFTGVPGATISGQVFHDLSDDGVKDIGEPGLHYWTVYLDSNANDAFDVGETSMLTDVSGYYSFAGLNPGTYLIRSVPQFGWTRTTSDPLGIVVSAPGQTFEDVDFGNLSVASPACTAVGADPVSCYPADNDALDYWDGNDGVLVSGADFEPGIVGPAFHFRGNNSVEVPDAANFRFGPTSPLTIELWAFRTGSAGVMHLLGKRDGCGAGNDFYQMAFDGGGLRFGSGFGNSVSTGVPLPPGRVRGDAARRVRGPDRPRDGDDGRASDGARRRRLRTRHR